MSRIEFRLVHGSILEFTMTSPQRTQHESIRARFKIPHYSGFRKSNEDSKHVKVHLLWSIQAQDVISYFPIRS